MFNSKYCLFLVGLVTVFPLTTSKVNTAVMTLDFEGLEDQEAIKNFYNDGFGGDGSGPGPDFDITFSPNALAIIDEDAGGSGNFGGEPSPDTTMFFLGGNAATMNIPDGFDTGFSFFYTAISNSGFVSIYDDVSATGNLLATIDLPTTPVEEEPDPTGQFSPLVPIGVDFNGTARSVDFGGTINQIGFDNIVLGASDPTTPNTDPDPNPNPDPNPDPDPDPNPDPDSPNPAVVPEPASIFSLLTMGALGVGSLKRKKNS